MKHFNIASQLCDCVVQQLFKKLIILAIFLLIGCSANKGQKINVEHHISNKDIMDILSIVTSKLETEIGKKLLNQPKVNFLTRKELRAHILDRSGHNDGKTSQTLTDYSQTIAAIYNPNDKGIYVVPENIEIYEQVNSTSSDAAYDALLQILSHELVHALQDQEGLLSWQGDSKTEERAFSMLVEGHAELQTAIILKSMGVVSDIYVYGTHRAPTKTDDEEFNKYSNKFALKYLIGKKIFNKIHKQYGNVSAWQILKNPEEQIKLIISKVDD